MTIYIAVFLLSAIIAKIGMGRRHFKEGTRWPTALAAMIPPAFVAGFRYFVGTDYSAYYRAFFTIARGGTTQFEWLYVWINKMVARLGGDYVWMFTIIALIFLIPIYLHIFEYSPYPILSIFLLFGMTYYFAFLNQMRQLAASAILMYAMRYIEDEKPVRFGIAVVIAAGFHASSWVFAILYFLRKLRLTPVKAVMIAIASYIFYNPISLLIIRLLQETEYDTYMSSELGISRARFLTQIAVMLVASLWYNRSERYRQYYLSNYIAICAAAFGGMVAYAHRMIYTFGLSAIMLVPMAISEMRTKRDRLIATTVVVVCYTVYMYYYIGCMGIHEVAPYRFVFQYLK